MNERDLSRRLFTLGHGRMFVSRLPKLFIGDETVSGKILVPVGQLRTDKPWIVLLQIVEPPSDVYCLQMFQVLLVPFQHRRRDKHTGIAIK